MAALLLPLEMQRMLDGYAASPEKHPVKVEDALLVLLGRSRESVEKSLISNTIFIADIHFVRKGDTYFLSKDAFIILCTIASCNGRGGSKVAATATLEYFERSLHEQREVEEKTAAGVGGMKDLPKGSG